MLAAAAARRAPSAERRAPSAEVYGRSLIPCAGLIAQQPVSLVGKPQASRKRFRFPDDLRDTPVVLPGSANSLRASFDLLMDEAGIRPMIAAEVDDMAMLRLIARETDALTLVPPVVVRDELRAKLLVERCRIPQIQESFFAISASRSFPNPLVRELLATTAAGSMPKKDAPSRRRVEVGGCRAR
jgi:LysR family transcriptional activator of nhaA